MRSRLYIIYSSFIHTRFNFTNLFKSFCSKMIFVYVSRIEEEFFFVYPYSHATYIDHGGVYFARFPVRSPRTGGTLQAPHLPSAQACPKMLV